MSGCAAKHSRRAGLSEAVVRATLTAMHSRFHHRIAITLMAILLQLHAVVVLAMPCGQCLPGDGIEQIAPCHMEKGMAVSEADVAGLQSDDQGCNHCNAGACGSAVTLLPPVDATAMPSFSAVLASVLLPPASSPGQPSLPYRPPIL